MTFSHRYFNPIRIMDGHLIYWHNCDDSVDFSDPTFFDDDYEVAFETGIDGPVVLPTRIYTQMSSQYDYVYSGYTYTPILLTEQVISDGNGRGKYEGIGRRNRKDIYFETTPPDNGTMIISIKFKVDEVIDTLSYPNNLFTGRFFCLLSVMNFTYGYHHEINFDISSTRTTDITKRLYYDDDGISPVKFIDEEDNYVDSEWWDSSFYNDFLPAESILHLTWEPTANEDELLMKMYVDNVLQGSYTKDVYEDEDDKWFGISVIANTLISSLEADTHQALIEILIDNVRIFDMTIADITPYLGR